jgi:hypothetical protein
MASQAHPRAQFGDLVVAAFDEAATHCKDSEELSRLAAQTIACVLALECGIAAPWRVLFDHAEPSAWPLAEVIRHGVLGGRGTW